jgi:hypothetical protein
MKNPKGIFTVVFLVVILIVVGAMTYHALVAAPRAAQEQQILKQYNFPGNMQNKLPSSGFPSGNEGIGSEDPEINSMLKTLNEANDEGATQDLQELEKEIQSL